MFEGQISWDLCDSSQAVIGDLHVLEARHCITAMLEALKLLKESVYPFLLIHKRIFLKSIQKELHDLHVHMRTGTLLGRIIFRVISCHLICDGAKQVVSKVAATRQQCRHILRLGPQTHQLLGFLEPLLKPYAMPKHATKRIKHISHSYNHDPHPPVFWFPWRRKATSLPPPFGVASSGQHS